MGETENGLVGARLGARTPGQLGPFCAYGRPRLKRGVKSGFSFEFSRNLAFGLLTGFKRSTMQLRPMGLVIAAVLAAPAAQAGSALSPAASFVSTLRTFRPL